MSTLDGNLSRINVHTGEATVVGNTDLSIISGLSYDSNRDALYAYAREEPGIFDDNRSFFELNRTDGSASFLSKPEVLISPTAYDAINQSIMGLGINSEGEHVVYSVNPINGNAVQLGSFDNDLNDVAFNAGLFPISLAHDRFTDTAFVVVASNAGPSTTTYGLVSFDKNNGMVVDRMGIGPNRQLSALAFVPDAVSEPSTVSVLSLVSGLLFSRRRREMRRK